MASKATPKRQEERSILINFVLDKSGSMSSIREATISGFNEFLGDQQREGGDARMTLTLFDTRFETVASAVPVRHVAPLNHETYHPDGMTALYDAIAHTMSITDDYVAQHHPDQVLFVIMTDGQENSSREFDQRAVFRMISDRREDKGYEFIYLGANQDSYAASQRIGIAPDRAMNWEATPEQASATMLRMSRNVRGYRRAGTALLANETFFTPEFEAVGAMEYEEYKQRQEAGRGKTGKKA
ncbi:MAG TPA: hypothetical protein DCP20_08200 [Coriobacteriia bacterium]|nr:hypothetical protein [Coriobacteriia bacterium]